MSTEEFKRRLTAILSADVPGYPQTLTYYSLAGTKWIHRMQGIKEMSSPSGHSYIILIG